MVEENYKNNKISPATQKPILKMYLRALVCVLLLLLLYDRNTRLPRSAPPRAIQTFRIKGFHAAVR